MGRPKGGIPWNKGIPRTEETKEKLRKSMLGRKHSLASIEKMKGKIPAFKGKKHTEESLNKMRRPKNLSIAGHESQRRYARLRIGDKNPKWKGGRIVRKDGRVIIYMPSHPHANLYGGTHILEYRVIAENKLGRYLLPNEIVHHIDKNPRNNDLDNLQIMTQSEHAKLHMSNRRKHDKSNNTR